MIDKLIILFIHVKSEKEINTNVFLVDTCFIFQKFHNIKMHKSSILRRLYYNPSSIIYRKY